MDLRSTDEGVVSVGLIPKRGDQHGLVKRGLGDSRLPAFYRLKTRPWCSVCDQDAHWQYGGPHLIHCRRDPSHTVYFKEWSSWREGLPLYFTDIAQTILPLAWKSQFVPTVWDTVSRVHRKVLDIRDRGLQHAPDPYDMNDVVRWAVRLRELEVVEGVLCLNQEEQEIPIPGHFSR